MSAEFFWTRFHRALEMDASKKVQGLPTLSNTIEWIDAYKSTLSNSKVKEFDKEWAKLDEQLRLARRKADFGK